MLGSTTSGASAPPAAAEIPKVAVERVDRYMASIRVSLSDGAAKLLRFLASKADSIHGISFWGRTRIASAIGCSNRSVQLYKAELISFGIIERVEHGALGTDNIWERARQSIVRVVNWTSSWVGQPLPETTPVTTPRLRPNSELTTPNSIEQTTPTSPETMTVHAGNLMFVGSVGELLPVETAELPGDRLHAAGFRPRKAAHVIAERYGRPRVDVVLRGLAAAQRRGVIIKDCGRWLRRALERKYEFDGAPSRVLGRTTTPTPTGETKRDSDAAWAAYQARVAARPVLPKWQPPPEPVAVTRPMTSDAEIKRRVALQLAALDKYQPTPVAIGGAR